MAALHDGPSGAALGAQISGFHSLTAFLSRHLQQQHASRALTAPAVNTPCSPQSGSAAEALTSHMSTSPPASGAHEPNCNILAAKSLDLPPTTSRRRKHPDSPSLAKLQALAEVSEDRLAKQEKRMLKNRESAARSRLRRQQHTDALESQNKALRSEVAGLKDQVAALQGRVAELEWQLRLSTGVPSAAATAAAVVDAKGQCITGQPNSKPMLKPSQAISAAPAASTAAPNNLKVTKEGVNSVQADAILSRTVATSTAAVAATDDATIRPRVAAIPSQATECGAKGASLIDALAAVCSGHCPPIPSAGITTAPAAAAAPAANNPGGDAAAATLLSVAKAAAALMQSEGVSNSSSQQTASKPAAMNGTRPAVSQQQQQQNQQLQQTASSSALHCSDPSPAAAVAGNMITNNLLLQLQAAAAAAAAAAPPVAPLALQADMLALSSSPLLATIQRLQGSTANHSASTADAETSGSGAVPCTANSTYRADQFTNRLDAPHCSEAPDVAAVLLQALQAVTAAAAAGSSDKGSSGEDKVANASSAAAAMCEAAAARDSARPSKRVCVQGIGLRSA